MDRPGEMVEVEWIDSLGQHGWHPHDADDDLLDELACRSVGYLVQDDTRGIVIIQSVQKDSRDNSIAIPRVAIQKVTRLRAR